MKNGSWRWRQYVPLKHLELYIMTKNHIPEDQTHTYLLPDMLLLKVRWRFGFGLCCGLSWETLFWYELRGGGLSAIISKDLKDCSKGVPNNIFSLNKYTLNSYTFTNTWKYQSTCKVFCSFWIEIVFSLCRMFFFQFVVFTDLLY
jgi:hypothetical protein